MSQAENRPVQTKPVPHCPECGAQMVLRSNRKTGNRFWGCSLYPDCRGTREIGQDGEPVYDEYDYSGSDWQDDPRHYRTNGVY